MDLDAYWKQEQANEKLAGSDKLVNPLGEAEDENTRINSADKSTLLNMADLGKNDI